MTILLVDDEELQLLRLENEVKKVVPSDATILSFSNSSKFLKDHKEDKIDIAFLDIEMPGMNGISLAKELKKINPLVNIIFVTAYNDYALEAYKIHASGYLSKPVSAEKIKKELEALRYPVELKGEKKLQIKCFGNFEIFRNGEPVRFSYQKSKEVFAYLVDREGSVINVNELNAVLWEEDHKSYLRNLIADIVTTLKNIDCSDVFLKKHNGCCIDVNKVDCDAYEYKKGNPNAIRMYRGEYMAQYPWPIFKD
ncbi:MAG: response regulator [Bacilli bacterium]|nr:response regulator [Bacilli bacterium]